MARERTVHTRPDGTLFYELRRTRKIEVPGTKGLKITEREEVPQLPTEGDPDTVVQMALNIMGGKTDSEKVERLANILNAGLVAEAQTAMQGKLNKAINANQVVSDFANIVNLTKSMFSDLTDSERATMILEKFPEIAQKLSDAGLEPLGEDDDAEEDEDETDE